MISKLQQPWLILSLPQVLGPYQLITRIAIGGQAEVWYALRTGPGGFRRKCALKILLPPNSIDDGIRKSFMAEARLMASFDHPNLISVTDLGEYEDANLLYSVMPYISGLTLSSVLSLRKIPPTHATWIIIKVLLALEHAHKLRDERGRALNICHRDISPENILVGFDGQLKLIDFGIALSSINPRNTRINFIKGKLDYLSPEQANGDRIDSRTDIYSIGLLYYTLLSGTNPLSGDPLKALQRARNPQFRPLSEYIVVPPELEDLLQQLLSIDPKQRPKDAGEIAFSLITILRQVDPHYAQSHFKEWMGTEFQKEMHQERQFLTSKNKGTQVIDDRK